MLIRYASHQTWKKVITANFLEDLGKNNKNRIQSTLRKLPECQISHEITPLTKETLKWFEPLYNKTINAKQNAKIFDIYSTTLGKDSPCQYFSLVLYENNEPIGATIFSERKDFMSIAYRVYPNDWSQHKLQAKPSLYTEYIINKHTYESGYQTLSHGRDRNPYGMNAHIGLAAFKLSIGCFPSVKKEAETDLLDTDKVSEDIFVIEYPEGGGRAKKGYLVAEETALEKYQQVLKYPEKISTEVILRKNSATEDA